jgi:hypothetical protein
MPTQLQLMVYIQIFFIYTIVIGFFSLTIVYVSNFLDDDNTVVKILSWSWLSFASIVIITHILKFFSLIL